jgi:tetratricopeptide (TPR) repeat protein
MHPGAPARGASQDYSPTEVAELLGLSLAEVRRCIREGFLTAAADAQGQTRLTFQDLVVLRKAASLVSARVPPYRVRRALRKLKSDLPVGQSLSSLNLEAAGKTILVRDGQVIWNLFSQQLLLNFDAPSGPNAALLPPKSASAAAASEADALYEQACDLELENEEAATAVYRRALTLVPSHAESRINLGRLLHARGELRAAEAEYRSVLAASPEHPLASFNLGVALEDLGRVDEAIGSYESALASDASCADAHFNAARLYERRGDRQSALRHLKAYRRLTQR